MFHFVLLIFYSPLAFPTGGLVINFSEDHLFFGCFIPFPSASIVKIFYCSKLNLFLLVVIFNNFIICPINYSFFASHASVVCKLFPMGNLWGKFSAINQEHTFSI